MINSVKISSCCMMVFPGPTKNSSSGTDFSPLRPEILALASRTSKAGATSADGVALAMLPPMVARLRIWIEPTSAAL